jgi:ribonuclease G
METKIIISATSEETRMGLTENGRLMEYLVERSSEKHLVGNIFKGRVNNVVPGIQAAFIDIGLQQNAFLYLGESTNKSMGTNSKTKTKILSFFFMLIFFAPFDFITH